MGVYDIMCFMHTAYGRTSILDAFVKEMRADLRAAPVEWGAAMYDSWQSITGRIESVLAQRSENRHESRMVAVYSG